MLELEPLLERLPKELSGGQKQRVALGRAIARQPAVFLMDEPLSNLDAKLRTGTRAQIVELQRQLGTTTLYVTHDQVEAMTMGHRIAVLNAGRLQQLGTPIGALPLARQSLRGPVHRQPADEPAAGGGGRARPAAGGGARRSPCRVPLEPLLASRQRPAPHRRPAAGAPAPGPRRQPQPGGRGEPRGGPGQRAAAHLPAAGGQPAGACAQRPGSDAGVGESVHLEVEPTGWRLFDGAGESLAPPRPSQPEGQPARREPQLPRLG